MKTLNEKIKNNFLPWVPFSSLNKNLRKYWRKKEGVEHLSNNEVNNYLPTFGSIIIPLILGGVYDGAGSLNPAKWSEIKEQRVQQEILEQQKFYREQFYNLDKNKDYRIDSTEFIYREKSSKCY